MRDAGLVLNICTGGGGHLLLELHPACHPRGLLTAGGAV